MSVTSNSMAQTIVIVGGGMAGLTAAVDLCDPSKYRPGAAHHKVILYEERSKVGGNIRSVPVEVTRSIGGVLQTQNASYDSGALQFFSFYSNVYDVARRVNVPQSLFRPFDIDPPLQFQTAPGVCQYLNERDWIQREFPVSESVDILRTKGYSLLTCPKEALSFYRPTPSAESTGAGATTSVAEYLSDTPTIGRFASTYATSYTYGNATETPAYSLLPMQTRPSDNQTSCYGQIEQLTEAMRSFVLAQGGKIVTGQSVHGIDTQLKQVHFTNTNLAPQMYDQVILAAPLGTVLINGMQIPGKVSQVNTDSKEPQYRYTRYLSVCYQLNKRPSATDADATRPGSRDSRWTALFDIPASQDNQGKPQVRSFLDLGLLPNLSGFVLAYIVVPENVDMNALANDHSRLMALVQEVAFFKQIAQTQNCHIQRVVYAEQFPHTMAVMNHSMRRVLEELTGRDGVHFAGAWQAAIPGVEAACFSGRSVAARIMGSYDAYMALMKQIDDSYVDQTRSLSSYLPSSISNVFNSMRAARHKPITKPDTKPEITSISSQSNLQPYLNPPTLTTTTNHCCGTHIVRHCCACPARRES